MCYIPDRVPYTVFYVDYCVKLPVVLNDNILLPLLHCFVKVPCITLQKINRGASPSLSLVFALLQVCLY